MCEPIARALVVVKLALPPLRVAVPRLVVPSMKVTEPVGVPLPGALALTVAVKVTDRPKSDGLAEETTVVFVVSWLTT